MNIKGITISLTFILLCILAVWQGNLFVPDSDIVWNRYRRLTWDDFKGYVPPFINHYASIDCDVVVNFNCPSRPEVYAYFNTKGSWTRNNGQDKYYELLHEQYHFNIAQLYTLKLQAAIDNLDNYCNQNEISRLENKFRELMNDTQKLYDSETNHSLDIEAQKKWITKINKELF